MVVALVLVSAFLHALWNALLRRERDKDRALVVAVAVAAALSAAVTGASALASDAPVLPTAGALAWSLISGVAELGYFYSLSRALDRGPLGSVYTVSRGGAILVAWPLSVALYGEPLAARSVAGSALVLVGVACAGGGLALPRAALAWSIACAVAIAGYHLTYKAALAAGGSPQAVFAISLGLATLINIVRLGDAGRRAAIGLASWRIALIGAILAASFLLLLDALTSGGTAVVLTTRNTSVLFALGLAALIGERPRPAQVAGAILVGAGALMMA